MTAFFEGWSWFKFNNLRLALGTNLKFYTSLLKGLKLKVRKFWGLIPTFVEGTGEKLVGEPFCPTPSPTHPPILNRVNVVLDIKFIYLNRRYLYKNKIYCLDKIYFYFCYFMQHNVKIGHFLGSSNKKCGFFLNYVVLV